MANKSLPVTTDSSKRIALYARVSTNRHRCRDCRRPFPIGGETDTVCPNPACQSTNVEQGQNPETQLMPLRDYARFRGLVIAEEYVDVGISGSKVSRPALDRLMAEAARRKFDIVIVARFDRFARSVQHLLVALGEFQALGIDFVSLNESIDTATPMGKMIFTVLGAVAELERNLIRERVIAGVSRARRQGKHLGRPKRIVDRDRILRLYAEHRSCRTVAAMCGVSKNKVATVVSENKTRAIV